MRANLLRRLSSLYFIVLIAYPLMITAQSTNKPISDNGFRIFNFGDSVEQYGTDVCEWSPVENIIRYKYCGNDTTVCKIGDIRFDNVVLCFNRENRLFSVDYSLYFTHDGSLKEFRKLQKDLNGKISVYLVSLYGKDYENTTDQKGASQTWKMKNMIVELNSFGGGNNYWCRFDISFRENFKQAE